MAITSDGALMRAYPDTCKSYKPDESKPTSARSVKLGTIYKCLNFERRNYKGDTGLDDYCHECLNKAYTVK